MVGNLFNTMNSGFRPIPKFYPFWTKVNIMIARGEAKDTSEAVRLINAQRPKRSKPSEVQQKLRLSYREPFKDN